MTIDCFSEFLKNLSSGFTPVIASRFSKEEYVAIDLSLQNNDLQHIDISSSKAFEDYIRDYLLINEAKVAYGGYVETRGIYRRSTHFNEQNPETERNIHLGLDLWCDVGTAVLSPLDGKVHSYKNNTNFGDYGPTIIVAHTINDITFYTLYGHLGINAIAHIEEGQKIKAGQVIATLGDASVNGDYAPHLHFQIIKNIQGYYGDYPGVSNKADVPYYLENCPDPLLLLKIE